MPKEPPNHSSFSLDQTLSDELDVLRWEILKHAQRLQEKTDAAAAASAGEDLVIFRFVYGIPKGKWEAMASRFNLADWMAMPLHGNTHAALRNMQQTLDTLAYAAGHDDLTGLARRDVFERILAAEMERARRTKSSVSLAVMDIDDFKRINDTCGHIHGDKVLRAFSTVLREGVRKTDFCARYGGEEFALIMPATSMVNAVQLLERLMSAARDLKIDGPEFPDAKFTFSTGLACYKGLGELSPEDFLEMADKALYLAKQKGKNRIEKAPFMDIAPPISDQTLVDSDEKKFLLNAIAKQPSD